MYDEPDMTQLKTTGTGGGFGFFPVYLSWVQARVFALVRAREPKAKPRYEKSIQIKLSLSERGWEGCSQSVAFFLI